MEEEFALQNCSNDDVLLFGSNTFKLNKFRSVVQKNLKQALPQFGNHMKAAGVEGALESTSPDKWLEGIECELLRPGATGWQQGIVKLKVVIEFHPSHAVALEESGSALVEGASDPSLDAIRQIVIDDR